MIGMTADTALTRGSLNVFLDFEGVSVSRFSGPGHLANGNQPAVAAEIEVDTVPGYAGLQ